MSELAYAIHFTSIVSQNCLVIDVMEVIKEKFGYQISSTSPRSLSQWQRLIHSSLDQEAFTFLVKEDTLFRQKNKKPPVSSSQLIHSFCILSSQAYQAITLLSSTQKVFCQGKQLVIDLFGEAELIYRGRSLKPKQLEIRGHIRWKDKEIALKECQALIPGKPIGFISGLSLKFLKPTLSWKDLLKLYQSPLLLEGTSIQQFLTDLKEEGDEAPPLLLEEQTIEDVQASLSPYPLVKLTDRTGAFATLWMNYESVALLPYHPSLSPISQIQSKSKFKRLIEEENRWEQDFLETDFIRKKVESADYYCPLDKVSKSLTFLLELGWTIYDYQDRRLIKQTAVNLQFEENLKKILIKGKLIYEDHEANVKDVLGAFTRRDTFISLSKETVGLLPTDHMRSTLENVADEVEWIGGEATISKNRFGVLGSLWQDAHCTSNLQTFKDNWQNFSGIEEAKPSTQFKGLLRPYQQQGVNWLNFLYQYGFHGLLADEMGLGKTVQILAFLSRLSQDLPHLIILPTSLLFNWRQEIERFLPDFDIYVHHGTERSKDELFLRNKTIILTSYTVLRLDLSLLKQLSYQTIILDEAQAIKNFNTQSAQAVRQLDGRMRLSITGTPVENHLQELWSHFYFIMPDLLGPLDHFQASIQAAQADHRHLDKIRRKIAPFCLRRLKNEVALDLPSRIDQVVWIEMDEKQRHFYDQLLYQFKNGLLKKVEQEGMSKHRMEIFEAILRLRQACCHPLLLTSFIQDDAAIPLSSKFEVLIEDLQTIVDDGQKVLVYSQFTSMLKLMTKEAHSRQWNYSYLDGSTKDREKEIKQFQEDSECNLFFISLKAGGVGLNLTAADYVYLYDPWWNEAVEEQAITRAHRIGRQQTVIAKRLVVAESIEERMMKLKAAKKGLVEELFSTDLSSSQLTLEDLYFLLD